MFFGVFALGWRGSARHWARWQKAYRITAAIAVPLVVSVHRRCRCCSPPGQVPGWNSTMFPPYFVLGAAFSGFAVVTMIAIVVRHALRPRRTSSPSGISTCSAKVLLATGLMTAYGYVAEVFNALYSGERTNSTRSTTASSAHMRGAIWGAVFLNFVPLQGLWLKRVRQSPVLLFVIGTSVVVGMWLERYMMLVTSLYRDFLLSSWGEYHATFWDWGAYLGTLGLFFTPFLLFLRYIPSISIFEDKEVLAREKEEARHG